MSSSTAVPQRATEWGLGTILIKVLAMVVPWGMIESALSQHPNIGYTIGIFTGVLCMHLVPPREKTLGRWLLVGVVMSVVHPLIVLFFPKSWR